MSPHAIERHDTSDPWLARRESHAERAARLAARARLLARVGEHVGGDGARWFADCLDAVADTASRHDARAFEPRAFDPRAFDLALALVPVRLGRETLEPERPESPEDGAPVDARRSGRWRVDDAARALLVAAAGDAGAAALLARALRSADAEARPGLFRSLPLLAHDDAIVALVREALDRGRRDVFEAIAHDNPWPSRHLRDPDWHRLVLRALALGSALAPIVGLGARADAALATRLIAHARRCRAVFRPVPVELWDALGHHATRDALAPFLPGGGALDAPWPDDATHAALARAVLRSGDPALAPPGKRRARPRTRLVGVPSARGRSPERRR